MTIPGSAGDDLFSLAGRDIWVIGGAGYLGQATVQALVAARARVLCFDLEGKAAAFVAEGGLSGSVTPAVLDARDTDETVRTADEWMAARGVPHGLVNLTFSSTAKTLEELTAAEFDAVCHGNLTSTFVLARAVGTRMAQAGRGSLVLFSSMYGTVSPDPAVYECPMNKNPVEYGVGKAGVVQMTRYLAVHWGRQEVRCNCISPGPFPNPSIQHDHPGFVDRLARKTPLGRIGQSPEIAGAVIFLLSDASSYMTGQNLFVDGGWTVW